jgi:hypothetical protein
VVQNHPCDLRATWRPVARNIIAADDDAGSEAVWPVGRIDYTFGVVYTSTVVITTTRQATCTDKCQILLIPVSGCLTPQYRPPECVFIFNSSVPHFSYNHMSLSFPFSAVYSSITCICWRGIVNFITYDPNVNRTETFNVTTDVTLCCRVSDFRRFEETSGFILKESSNLRGLSDPWRWRHYVPSQRRKPLAKRHGVISQKTWILSNTSGKISILLKLAVLCDAYFHIIFKCKETRLCAIRESKNPDRTINEFSLWRTA